MDPCGHGVNCVVTNQGLTVGEESDGKSNETVINSWSFHNSRKRPHVPLQYEGQPVRVKQEFPDHHDSYHYHNTNIAPTAVKTEPHNMFGMNGAHILTTPPPPPPLSHHHLPSYHHLPPHPTTISSSVQYPNTLSHCHTNQPLSNGAPLPPTVPTAGDQFFPFTPWGLDGPVGTSSNLGPEERGWGGGGGTFGSLVGVDMTQSLVEGSEFMAPPTFSSPEVKKGRSSKSRLKREMEEDDGWEPPLWKQQLQNIVKMREARDAPVDLMGAHKNAEQTTSVTPQVRRYQVLVSLMLSSQTKDQITAQAMKALKQHGLTIDNILNTPEEDIAKLIHPVGFWRKKAGYIKKVSQILKDQYGEDIPNTMDGLCSLPGVGPKMSHLVMDIAWDNTSGVAVDTHVHRIAHRLGWMREPTENPEVTRVCIEKWLPKSEWRELNWLLVGFGQQRCQPNNPKCRGCLNEDICPASKLKDGGPWGKKKKSPAVKKEVKTEPT